MTGPRRILLGADAVGGVFDYTLELGRGLLGAGHEVVVAVLGPPPNEAQLFAAEAAGLPLHLHAGQLEWMDEPWADVDRAGRWLVELATREAVDLVQLGGYAHAAAGFAVPVVVVAHSCVLSWWRAVKGEAAPARWDTYRRRTAVGLAMADAVVAPTHAMARMLSECHGLEREIVVINNGRDAREWRAGRKAPVVLAAGRVWDEGKNLAVLALVAEAIPWPIKVAGDDRGAELDGLLRLGRLPPAALAREYAEAAIFVHPALYEPFGLSVLEAALAGAALVLGDLPSLRELWAGAAVFVDPRDPAAIAAALRRLIADPDGRAALGRRAAARAAEFPRASMVAGYRALFARLSARSAGKEVACAS